MAGRTRKSIVAGPELGKTAVRPRCTRVGGPGDGPLTIDLDSTICETCGLAKEGARHHGYTGQRGCHVNGSGLNPLWLVDGSGSGYSAEVQLCRGWSCPDAMEKISCEL